MNDQESIGKALEPLESGTGLIEVFVMLQEEERGGIGEQSCLQSSSAALLRALSWRRYQRTMT